MSQKSLKESTLVRMLFFPQDKSKEKFEIQVIIFFLFVEYKTSHLIWVSTDSIKAYFFSDYTSKVSGTGHSEFSKGDYFFLSFFLSAFPNSAVHFVKQFS